jgi:hypothetical protein
MIIRFDYVFSYWIFAWYILYELKIVDYNPKFALLLGIIENIIILLFMFYYNNSLIYIFLFCVINFFIKVIPLWRLRNINYDNYDIIASIGLFIIYFGWLVFNRVNISVMIKNSVDSIKNNNTNMPFIYYVSKMIRFVSLITHQ